LIDPPEFSPSPPPPDPQLRVVIRAARARDQAAIVAFNLQLAAESEGKELDPNIVARGVEQALADPDRLRYWIAETQETGGRADVVGQAAISREWSDWRNGWIWWLQSVYVHPDQRRHGVFRALYDHIKAAALSAGDVTGVRLYVENDNEPAQRTYEALGLKPGGYHVLEDFWGSESGE
jgi:ribosomal protein S18 acetylase RimI-like enzyme